MANEPDGRVAPEAPAGAGYGQGAIVLVAVAIAIAVFIAFMAFVSIPEYWCGLLFLWYWGSVEQTNMKRLAPSFVGALIGLGIAYLFVVLPPLIGAAAGMGIAMAVIVIAVYFLIVGRFEYCINNCTMLFLTAGTIPVIQHNVIFVGEVISLVCGAVFFGGLIGVSSWLDGDRQGNR